MRKAGLVLFFCLAACATNGSHRIRPLRPLELATAPYLDTVSQRGTGSLMYEGGCLLFREDGSLARYLPVWPSGSIFNGALVIFHKPAKADQRVVVGEEFVMGGVAGSWASLRDPNFRPFQHQCGAPPFFVSEIRPAD